MNRAKNCSRSHWLLYYPRVVDATMLPALGTMETQQANPTKNTMKKVIQFSQASTYPDAIIKYRASDTVLVIHIDASYLSESKARSRA